MDIELCRICGKQDHFYVNIFKTEGLQNKIETCLPIVVSEQCPLPDTICTECLDSVDNFYCFIKSCLQNIIILEAQYEILDSCLKIKRKVDRSVSVDPCDFVPITQTKPSTSIADPPNLSTSKGLVDYECSSDSDHDEPDEKKPSDTNNTVIDIKEKDIIDEIVERKYLKRKTRDDTPHYVSKLAKLESTANDSSSRRKSKAPKRVEYHLGARASPAPKKTSYYANNDALLLMDVPTPLLSLPADISIIREPLQQPMPGRYNQPPVPSQSQNQNQRQACLLCDQQTSGLLALAAHMYETHGIDLAQVYGNTSVMPTMSKAPSTACKNRKIPELVKISDVLGPRRQKNHETLDEVVVVESKSLPVQPPPVVVPPQKTQFSCVECPDSNIFPSFGEYSTHRRAQHQIFHCDLCPKFYGRNSHLWKHVNRVHKGHPSITCHQCYKTSASKYHLAQHFNKMHSTKTPTISSASKRTKSPEQPSQLLDDLVKDKNDDVGDEEDDLLNQKFQGFDFKSVRQSFLKQDLLTKRHNKINLKIETQNESIPPPTTTTTTTTTKHGKKMCDANDARAPKEIDSSSDLYTNIITNYSPRQNEGPYKCAKCFKGFHKKNLLIKHKKNCRPRLQKDLLTRCKTCSRIFKDRQSLAKHLVNYHSEYTCEICQVAVQSKCEIVSHIRFTHPNSELQCHCGQILRSQSDLARHKSDHRDSHVCQFCGDALPTKIKLKMHILSLHRKILSLSCGICLKLFETQHILKEHVRLVHGDQLQPLTSCTVCGKNYGSKWKTYDHLNKSHGRIFKACKACLDVFETERELQLHFEREHLRNGTTVPKAIPQQKSKNHIAAAAVEELNGDVSPSPEDAPPQLESSSSSSSSSSDDGDTEEEVLPEEEEELKVFKVQNGLFGKGAQDTKLSLLEKRLIGKKIKDEKDDKTKKKKKDDQTTKQSNHLPNRSNQPTNPISEPDDLYIATLSPSIKNESIDILQNSSKRTVYVNSNDPSLCEICLKVWPAKKHLWQHYIRCHKQVAATVCGICLKTNPSYSSLDTHLRETHPNLLHGCGFGSNFICKICGRYHNASSKLKLHMAIHVGFTAGDDQAGVKMEIKEEMDEQDDEDDEEDEENDDDETECNEDDKPQSDSECDTADEETLVKDEPQVKQEDINYESMIEEIEASSDSNSQMPVAQEANTSSEDESDSTPSENGAEQLTENELEQEMLKNMIGENRSVQLQVKTEFEVKQEPQAMEAFEIEVVDEYDVKMEVWRSDEEEEEEDNEENENWDESTAAAFVVKQSEVDDAIRSISMDADDYGESLNESELETAVGSIL